MDDIKQFLDSYVPAPLTRHGHLLVRECTTQDLATAIKIMQNEFPNRTERLKKLRRQMNKYGVLYPTYLPYLVLEAL